MATTTTNYNLIKPAETDFYNIADSNGNMDIIDAELAKRASLDESGKLESSVIPDIDCGIWDSNAVMAHNAAQTAHGNLIVDGNQDTNADTSSTLEEHMINPMAHQNIILDGNDNQ